MHVVAQLDHLVGVLGKDLSSNFEGLLQTGEAPSSRTEVQPGVEGPRSITLGCLAAWCTLLLVSKLVGYHPPVRGSLRSRVVSHFASLGAQFSVSIVVGLDLLAGRSAHTRCQGSAEQI